MLCPIIRNFEGRNPHSGLEPESTEIADQVRDEEFGSDEGKRREEREGE